MRYAVAPLVALALLLPTAVAAPAATAPGAASPGDVRPRVDVLKAPLGPVAQGLVPDRTRLTRAVVDELDSSWLGATGRRSLVVRDALTGEDLAGRSSGLLVTPASTTKLLSAAAIVTGLDPDRTFTTRVLAGAEPGQVVIVAGGDMLLGDGAGDPEAVAGHAGIADLAAQTARSLKEQGEGGRVSVALDLSHVRGPSVQPTWKQHWVDEGYTGRIVQLGREQDRALPYYPSPASPEQAVARVFREQLAERGVDVVGAGDDETSAGQVEVEAGATELAAVESAPVRDVLALALATSDNAMLEQLARQAAVADGQSADQQAVTAWIVDTMTSDYGIDMTGMTIADPSGLSDGTRLSMGAVASVLVAGSDGSHPALQEVLGAGGLPIAGYTGTLGNGRRFHLPVHAPAVGAVRAKTGTLPGVVALAGTVVTQDGRLLVFAVGADEVGRHAAGVEAASVLDEIAAELARCGC